MYRLNDLLPAVLCVLLALLWLVIRHHDLIGPSALFKGLAFLIVWAYLCLVIRSLCEGLQVDFLIYHTDMRYPNHVIWAWVGNLLVLTAATPIGAWGLLRFFRLPVLDCLVGAWVAAVIPQIVNLLILLTPIGRQLIWYP